jgi:outer membrane protein OmpA-like peptidoglycan-associated protein
MRTIRTASTAVGTILAVAGLGLAGLVALPAAALAVPSTSVSTGASASAARSWFHDPVSAAGRRAEIAVPADPTGYSGARRHTRATFRTHTGLIAVPFSWAHGHDVVRSQALALTNASLFRFNSPTPTRVARTELRRLTPSLALVRTVRCEGYTDFGGVPSHEQTLSLQRARAICALVHKDRKRIVTSSVGYGGTEPVVVGGTTDDRAQNRRVVVVVTSSSPLATAPGAPRLSAAVAGDTTAAITFARPTDTGGSTVTGYQVSTDGGRSWRSRITTGSSPYTLTLRGLTNGTTYPVSVRALNLVGHSAASNTRTVTPRSSGTVSGPPTLTSAIPGDGSATITFAAPSSDGGVAITGYQVSVDSATTWTTVATTGSSPFTDTLTGLGNGTTYPVTVRAVNSVGDSAASNSLDVTPALPPVVPDAPTLTAATSGNASASITFAAPSSDGGAAITGYEVSTDGTTWSPLTTTGSGPFTATVSGLRNGTTYPVTVRAVNSVGDGAASNSLDVTPATVPSEPDLSVINSGDSQVTLTFSAPFSDGGSAITSYQVSLNGTWTTVPTTGSSPYTVTIGGLSNGTLYFVYVRAVNAVGDGAAGGGDAFTPESF